ncbi:MAG TPA: hypothetical protein V6C90_21140 [Coleofasciculaceae cyanobacterium]
MLTCFSLKLVITSFTVAPTIPVSCKPDYQSQFLTNRHEAIGGKKLLIFLIIHLFGQDSASLGNTTYFTILKGAQLSYGSLSDGLICFKTNTMLREPGNLVKVKLYE